MISYLVKEARRISLWGRCFIALLDSSAFKSIRWFSAYNLTNYSTHKGTSSRMRAGYFKNFKGSQELFKYNLDDIRFWGDENVWGTTRVRRDFWGRQMRSPEFIDFENPEVIRFLFRHFLGWFFSDVSIDKSFWPCRGVLCPNPRWLEEAEINNNSNENKKNELQSRSTG